MDVRVDNNLVIDVQTPIIHWGADQQQQAFLYREAADKALQDGRVILMSAELFYNMLHAIAEGME